MPGLIKKNPLSQAEDKNGGQTFVYSNTSGVCNLNCSYCFTGCKKNGVSLTKDDFAFLIDSIGDDIIFAFSGYGDFFAGYRKADRLLEYLLSNARGMYLDTNGVSCREFPEISQHLVDRITKLDLSFHYMTMKNQGLLDKYLTTLSIFADRIPAERMTIKTIFAYSEMGDWDEICEFYKENVHGILGIPLSIVNDEYCDKVKGERPRRVMEAVADKYADVTSLRRRIVDADDYSPMKQYDCTRDKKDEPCFTGSKYFRIDNQGYVGLCPVLHEQGYKACGNLKERVLVKHKWAFMCKELSGNPNCNLSWCSRMSAETEKRLEPIPASTVEKTSVSVSS